MDGGWTKNRRRIPPTEKPINWVLITTIHWSVEDVSPRVRASDAHTEELTYEIVVLVVEYTLNGDDIGLH